MRSGQRHQEVQNDPAHTQANARHLAAQGAGATRKELVMSMVDHLIERGWLAYGPYNELSITERAWPLCVAVMAAMLLVAAYIEGRTVIVP